VRLFSSSPFDGVPGEGRAAKLYRALAQSRFAALPEGLTDEDAQLLERYLSLRLKLEREERRMHFGALALMSLLFFLVLPAVLRDPGSLTLDLLALLLLALVIPYVFVYFGYENRVRAMSTALLRLISRR
jgi:hypothetical protein